MKVIKVYYSEISYSTEHCLRLFDIEKKMLNNLW